MCKQWNHSLRSLDVLKKGLNQWYAGSFNLQNADYALCKQKARAVHNFRNGNPTRFFQIHLSEKVCEMTLVGNTLILDTPGNLRSITLLNLNTWEISTVSTDARETLLGFAASDQIVAFRTYSSVVHVMTLQGEGRKTFRVPHIMYLNGITCRGRTVAYVGSSHDHIDVYIWDYDTQRTKSFNVTRHPSHLFFANAME